VAKVAVRVPEVVRQFAGAEIYDVVLTRRRCAVQAGGGAHPVSDGVIRARGVAADPKPADHLAVHIKRDPAAKCDDASRNLSYPRSLRLECRVEWVGIIQAVE
jgi:hypothetical protein